MQTTDKIYVAGHRGLVGTALLRRLVGGGYTNLLLRTHAELDLRDQAAVRDFFAAEQPDYVFLAAAKVGGIHANATYPAEFIYDNLAIATNVIDAAWRNNTKKLLFLGSSCIYPKFAPQPIPEDALLTSALEPTNESYAVAKIAGIKLCQAYRRQYGFDAISAMPTNLYGPHDNFHPENAHVLPALMGRFHEARKSGAPAVRVWGSGQALREFLYADDLADALVFLMQHYSEETHINVGAGEEGEVPISTLAALIAEAVGYTGTIEQDTSKPDGTPRKLLDCTRLRALGWAPSTALRDGIRQTYEWYVRYVVGAGQG